MDWGTLPDWFAAIGTIGAFAVALWLLRGQLKVYRAAEEDRIQGDARKVGVWWSRADDEDRIAVHLKNAGENPIYDCIVYVSPLDENKRVFDFNFYTIAPGETQTWDIPGDHFTVVGKGALPDEDGIYSMHLIEIVFTDSAGRHWRRLKNGQLIQRKTRSIHS